MAWRAARELERRGPVAFLLRLEKPSDTRYSRRSDKDGNAAGVLGRPRGAGRSGARSSTDCTSCTSEHGLLATRRTTSRSRDAPSARGSIRSRSTRPAARERSVLPSTHYRRVPIAWSLGSRSPLLEAPARDESRALYDRANRTEAEAVRTVKRFIEREDDLSEGCPSASRGTTSCQSSRRAPT